MIEFTLPTMTCGHCVRSVTEAVQRLDAQAELKFDLPTHHVSIQTQLPAATLAQALAAEGYAPA